MTGAPSRRARPGGLRPAIRRTRNMADGARGGADESVHVVEAVRTKDRAAGLVPA